MQFPVEPIAPGYDATLAIAYPNAFADAVSLNSGVLVAQFRTSLDADAVLFEARSDAGSIVVARDKAGTEWLLVNRDADVDDIRPVIEHEISHLVTWREFGENVAEHGTRFRAVCRRIVEMRPAYFCKDDS